jgi:hypothetical protein
VIRGVIFDCSILINVWCLSENSEIYLNDVLDIEKTITMFNPAKALFNYHQQSSKEALQQ